MVAVCDRILPLSLQVMSSLQDIKGRPSATSDQITTGEDTRLDCENIGSWMQFNGLCIIVHNQSSIWNMIACHQQTSSMLYLMLEYYTIANVFATRIFHFLNWKELSGYIIYESSWDKRKSVLLCAKLTILKVEINPPYHTDLRAVYMEAKLVCLETAYWSHIYIMRKFDHANKDNFVVLIYCFDNIWKLKTNSQQHF